MRRKEDRTNRILELLVKEKKLEVAEISGHLPTGCPGHGGADGAPVRRELLGRQVLHRC